VRYVPEPSGETALMMPPGPTSIVHSRSWGEPFEVLLIEDNDDEIVLVQRTLKRAGLTDHPQVARDGRAALDALLGTNRIATEASPLGDVPDVILLDLGLPKVSGLNVLRRIKETGRVADIPVVVLSGANDEGMAQACMNLGANTYIVKPISHVQVMNIIVAVQKHWLASENFGEFDIDWSERRAA
jgi:two-component system response regulator